MPAQRGKQNGGSNRMSEKKRGKCVRAAEILFTAKQPIRESRCRWRGRRAATGEQQSKKQKKTKQRGR